MNTPLSTFPTPRLRLILCGDGGLAPAWGPLDGSAIRASCGTVAWNPTWEKVYSDRGVEFWPLEEPEGWSLPLDAESPWPARLALVAAYLTWRATSPTVLIDPPRFNMIAASVDQVFDEWENGQVIALTRFAHRGPLPSAHTWKWSAKTGFCWGNGPNLPTLPQHLQTHPPAVALLLALFDVPEIRARVESLHVG